ncbi:hypothetical protein HKK52_26280 [Pseudomonas sp. ADAK2]|nr:hypothetical protein HKK53_26280 [Pseudomonas sp. ADAK7]QJI51948.1 hypothetical protein HKK52_26280 [Pseudomonas sp. ADAK2]
MELFSYKMTHDTGFAPNPFGHTLTLATCKPSIRLHKRVGQWIAGFTSVTLNRDPVGEERLVYLMRIGEKCHVRDYFSDPRFQDKVPGSHLNDPIAKAGDNIYCPLVPGAAEFSHFEQLKNENHWADCGPSRTHLEEDISGQYVLVADVFYYFGSCPLSIHDFCRPQIPKGQANHGYLTQSEQAERFIRFVQDNYKPGIQCSPTKWRSCEAIEKSFDTGKSYGSC